MPSDKRQRQDQARLLRLEEERQSAHKARQRSGAKWGVMAVVGVAVVGLVIALLSGGDDDDVATGDATTTTVDAEATTTSVASTPGDPAIGSTPCPPADGSAEPTTTFESGPEACIDVAKTYIAEVETSRGVFTVELDAEVAPKAVNNFVFLARNHYYDGVSFHRIIPGFVVQGGDPNGDPPGTGDPGYSFPDELPTEGPPFYEVGSIAMANSGPDTNGSQFFVVTGEQGAQLPASYTLFGKVTDGMDVVMAIEATGTEAGEPTEPTTITTVSITEA